MSHGFSGSTAPNAAWNFSNEARIILNWRRNSRVEAELVEDARLMRNPGAAMAAVNFGEILALDRRLTFGAWVTTNLRQCIVGGPVQFPAPVTFILSQLERAQTP